VREEKDLQYVNASEVQVWQQFQVTVKFNSQVHHVMASAHETVLSLRRKLCAVLSIECSSCSPVLATFSASPAKPGVTLKDSQQLARLNIFNDVELSISCPVPGFAPAEPTQPSVTCHTSDPPPLPPHLADDSLMKIDMTAGELRGALVVNVHCKVSGSKRPFSFTNVEAGCDVLRLKRLLELNLSIPVAMQTLSAADQAGNFGVRQDACVLQTLNKTIECHTQDPPHFYIRSCPIDGPETMQTVGSCVSPAPDILTRPAADFGDFF
jgi:hypothetical protein